MTAFASFLGAHQPGARPARRRLLVSCSVLGHLGLLVGAAIVGVRQAPAASPEPVHVQLTAPPGRRRPPPPPPPAAPRKPRSAPRPQLVQPVMVPVPPPVETPPPPEEEVDADVPEESTETAATDEPSGVPGGSPGAQPAPEPLFELREVARPPGVLSRVTPVYPRDCRLDRVEGTVVLRVIVGIDGAIERQRTRVIHSVPRLDAAAIAAIESWRFTPALGHAGHPVRVIIEVPFQFYLR